MMILNVPTAMRDDTKEINRSNNVDPLAVSLLICFKYLAENGHTGIWTQGLPHAKRMWYHYTMCPVAGIMKPRTPVGIRSRNLRLSIPQRLFVRASPGAFFYKHLWSSGYDVSLTRWRSPVRSWPGVFSQGFTRPERPPMPCNHSNGRRCCALAVWARTSKCCILLACSTHSKTLALSELTRSIH